MLLVSFRPLLLLLLRHCSRYSYKRPRDPRAHPRPPCHFSVVIQPGPGGAGLEDIDTRHLLLRSGEIHIAAQMELEIPNFSFVARNGGVVADPDLLRHL